VKTQKSLFLNHIAPHLPEPLGDVEQLPELMKEPWSDLSPQTQKMLLSILCKYVRLVTKKEVNFTNHVRRLAKPASDLTVWTLDECNVALQKAMKYDMELYKMLLTTLLFRSRIKINRSYDGPTKNGKPRTIPMTLELEDMFKDDYTVGADDELIFKRCDPNNRLKVLCKIAGLPELTWHGLRHTFATLALEAGRSPKRVSAILGHSKLSTTLDIYWQATGEDMDMGFISGGQ
jgi:hypothetical protein